MDRKNICNKLREESTCDDCENCEVWTEQIEPIFNEIRADERASVLEEVTVGINSIINEYAIDGKVLTCLITKYIERKCDWLNK